MDLNQYLNPEIIASLQTWGYLLMFGVMVIEWPIITFIAAFLASLWFFDITLVFLLGWTGDIVWDLLFYSIGRFGWHIFEKKTTIDTPKEHFLIEKLNTLINKNLALAILVIKFTPYAAPIGLSYMGKMRLDIKKYLVYSCILCAPIPIISALIWYHIGMINRVISSYSGMTLVSYLLGGIAIIAVAIISLLVLKQISARVLGKQDIIVSETSKNTTSDTTNDASA